MVADILEKKSVQQYTLEEYLELEEKAAFKSEFRNGRIIKMAGGTYEHGVLHLTISALLFMASLKRKDLQVFSNDQRIYLEQFNQIVYADCSALVGEREMHNNIALRNPMLVFEVLSNSTERYDKGVKFRKYQSIPSFEEYVLVSQDTPIIDVLTKTEEGWLMKSYIGLDKEIHFKSIDVTLKMADVYQKIDNLKDPQSVLNFELDEDE